MNRKSLVTILAVTLLISVIAPATSLAAEGYTDVKSGDWFYNSVNTLSADGIISGNPDGTFKPEDMVTYGEFIAMAVKTATGTELPAAEAPSHWSKNYYDLALEKSYFTQNDIGTAVLNMPIPRGYMALLCSRILDDTIEVKGEFFDLLEKTVKDISSITPYEYEIIRSYGAGILSGYPDKTFRPDSTLTRAESASVIWHLADESQRKIPNIDQLREEAARPPVAKTQEERIQTILTNGPQKISFDPAADITKDDEGRTVMKEDKAREYMDQILASLKFYGEKGKYYMTVTLPEVPEGYQVHFSANIAYKQALMKPQWSASTNLASYADSKLLQSTTSTVQIKGLTNLKDLYTVGAGFSINKIDDTYLGSEEASYQMQWDYDGKTHFAINRQGSATGITENYEYDINRHYTWK